MFSGTYFVLLQSCEKLFGEEEGSGLKIKRVLEIKVNWIAMAEFIKEFLQELFVVLLWNRVVTRTVRG